MMSKTLNVLRVDSSGRHGLGCKRLLLSHLGREVLARQEEVSFECAHDGYVVEV